MDKPQIDILEKNINDFWDNIKTIDFLMDKEVKEKIKNTLELLDSGVLRICNRKEDDWIVNEWLKKAILMSFKTNKNRVFNSNISNLIRGQYTWFDKIDLKTSGWSEDDWTKKNYRAVPGCIVRYSAFIAKGVVLMPSFVNLGAYVDSGTMVDTWATVGSCAQIGKNVHISGGAGIGGVLEPLQAKPVIIEDNCFIGARSEIAEGVIVKTGSVISMGVYIGASTKIIDRETGEVFMGEIPPFSVVVPGNIQGKKMKDGSVGPSLYCAVIVKTVDEKTRSKTSINDLLRS
tara:strand:+ start:32364 stop:33230 length:867 start_codon:yes stop_codon:yes gene_type:complete